MLLLSKLLVMSASASVNRRRSVTWRFTFTPLWWKCLSRWQASRLVASKARTAILRPECIVVLQYDESVLQPRSP